MNFPANERQLHRTEDYKFFISDNLISEDFGTILLLSTIPIFSFVPFVVSYCHSHSGSFRCDVNEFSESRSSLYNNSG